MSSTGSASISYGASHGQVTPAFLGDETWRRERHRETQNEQNEQNEMMCLAIEEKTNDLAVIESKYLIKIAKRVLYFNAKLLRVQSTSSAFYQWKHLNTEQIILHERNNILTKRIASLVDKKRMLTHDATILEDAVDALRLQLVHQNMEFQSKMERLECKYEGKTFLLKDGSGTS